MNELGSFPGVALGDNPSDGSAMFLRKRPPIPLMGKQHIIIQANVQRVVC